VPTIARKRAVLHQVLEHGVEQGVFESNPLDRIRWKPPKVADTFDPRSVINPQQARALLAAVAAIGERENADPGRRVRPGNEPIIGTGVTSSRLVAFFALMYYSALRPSEASALKVGDVVLPPEDGPADAWGELRLNASNPEVTGRWNDGGRRVERHLKHRADGAVRPVPTPPELVSILRAHLIAPGPAPDGRLFYGPYGGTITVETYNGIWSRARRAVFTDAQFRSPLAARPYDLRHTAVSGWLAAGVDSAVVATWAGHSVAVLHRVYAHVVHGRQDEGRRRVANFLTDK
jgi:integrase